MQAIILSSQPFYDYIQNNIEPVAKSPDNGFDYTGGDVKEFVFEIAGVGSCVDVTMQTIMDDFEDEEIVAEDIIVEFIRWMEDVKGEKLETGEYNEIECIVMAHLGEM